jgi:hypothetical protein
VSRRRWSRAGDLRVVDDDEAVVDEFGSSAKMRCSIAREERRYTRSLDASLRAAGRCAMSSGGRS